MRAELRWALLAALALATACGAPEPESDDAVDLAAIRARADSVKQARAAGNPTTTVPADSGAAAPATPAGQAPGLTPEQQRVAAADSARAAAARAQASGARKAVLAERQDSVQAALASAARAESLMTDTDLKLRRETYVYRGGGRDPFLSLVRSSRDGPALGDLRLISIIEDAREPGRSVAIFRDKTTSKLYRLRRGDALGRLTVTAIRQKDVVFSLEDFGTRREEVVSLRKQEDLNP